MSGDVHWAKGDPEAQKWLLEWQGLGWKRCSRSSAADSVARAYAEALEREVYSGYYHDLFDHACVWENTETRKRVIVSHLYHAPMNSHYAAFNRVFKVTTSSKCWYCPGGTVRYTFEEIGWNLCALSPTGRISMKRLVEKFKSACVDIVREKHGEPLKTTDEE